MSLNIAHWEVPEPSIEFQNKVRLELAIANQLDFNGKILNQTRNDGRILPAAPTCTQRSVGNCRRCGCDLDDKTYGCQSCRHRHYMRRRALRT